MLIHPDQAMAAHELIERTGADPQRVGLIVGGIQSELGDLVPLNGEVGLYLAMPGVSNSRRVIHRSRQGARAQEGSSAPGQISIDNQSNDIHKALTRGRREAQGLVAMQSRRDPRKTYSKGAGSV